MRILVDLFSCQTESRFRGMGRYTHDLTRALINQKDHHEIYLMANPRMVDSFETLRQEFTKLLPSGNFLPYYYPEINPKEARDNDFQQIIPAFINQAKNCISPDWVITPGLFEGWGHPEPIFPVLKAPGKTFKNALILHDFIPLLFPEQYFSRDVSFEKWYRNQLNMLQNYDLFFSNSEATRQDAIKLFGISPDRIVNISGASNSSFREISIPENEKQEFLQKYGITRPFVFFASALDFRKNTGGALSAYANLSKELINQYQLVLTQVFNIREFRKTIRDYGLSDQDVIVTGYIPDEDLVRFYNLCTVFMFPSLYEGFGLPILEAMACGAPVICSDNSSMPEVIGRKDVLFNASEPASITDVLTRVLENPQYRKALTRYGLQRCKEFSWDQSAAKALTAMENVIDEANPVAPQKGKIAYMLPTSDAGQRLKDWEIKLILCLSKYYSITLFTDSDLKPDDLRLSQFTIENYQNILTNKNAYATIIYQLWNNQSYSWVPDACFQFPGIIVFHDFSLNNHFAKADENQLLQSLFENHGIKAVVDHHLKGPHKSDRWPLNWQLMRWAKEIIVDSNETMRDINHFYSHGWKPRIIYAGMNSRNEENSGDSDTLARLYIDTIDRAIAEDERMILAPVGEEFNNPLTSFEKKQKFSKIAAANFSIRDQTKILIDVTPTNLHDGRSGIQRVVKCIVRELLGSDLTLINIEPVILVNGKLHHAYRFIEKLFDLPENILKEETAVSVSPGTTLLLLDSNWTFYDQFIPLFQQIRSGGGKIFTMVHDTIPYKYPGTCVRGLPPIFSAWLRSAFNESDGIVCNSKSTADSVVEFQTENAIVPRQKLEIRYFHLGADIPIIPTEKNIRPEIESILSKDKPLFILVGTLEPRKGHEFVLNTFEKIWSDPDCPDLLIFAGKAGWKMEAFIEKIRKHPERKKRFFFIENPSDAELTVLYENSTALIAASIAEGYGLPIVEAALHKVPVIASDIPVFREVGGEGCLYFSLNSSEGLIRSIVEAKSLSKQERIRIAGKVNVLTWKQSAEWLLQLIQ